MMKKLLAVFVAVAIAVGALVPVLAQTGTASACTEGLTPGYWKNHPDAWVTYDPDSDTTFRDVFGVGPEETLMDVLNTGGGKWDALNRHAVAALLNAADPDIDYWDEGWVISHVQQAYGDQEWAPLKARLEYWNELGVPDD